MFKKNSIFKKILIITIFLLISFFYIYKLGTVPAGLFCDEAKVGLTTYQLLNNNTSSFMNPFFYRHFSYIFGALPIYTTTPFIYLFGLNDFSVRLASVFFAITSLILIYAILNLVNIKHKLPIVFLFAFTPIFFHISRINFSHLCSLSFILFGYYLYLRSKYFGEKTSLFISGLFFGFAFYGYPGYIIGIPIFLFSIVITEIIENKQDRCKYKSLVKLLVLIVIICIPLLISILTNNIYVKRLQDKNVGNIPFTSVDKVKTMIENYPKYYTYNFLFKIASKDLGEDISRHSIKGNGIFLSISFVFLLFAIIALFLDKDKKKISFLPFFILFLLYPIPDLLTTKNNVPPYSFSIFSTIFFFPFLAAYGLDFLMRLLSKNNIVKNILLSTIIIILLIQSILFLNNYKKYPLYSSDYWGWQFGFKEIFDYYSMEKNKYDELFIIGSFNEADVLLKFYDPNRKCQNCFIGGIENYNFFKKQLFVFRVGEIPQIKKLYPDLKFNIIKNIYLPNGQIEYKIGYFNKIK